MSLRSASRSNSWARVGISFSVQILRLHALLEEALEAKREEDLAFGPGQPPPRPPSPPGTRSTDGKHIVVTDDLLTSLLIRVTWCLSRTAKLEAGEDEEDREDEEDSDPDFE